MYTTSLAKWPTARTAKPSGSAGRHLVMAHLPGKIELGALVPGRVQEIAAAAAAHRHVAAPAREGAPRRPRSPPRRFPSPGRAPPRGAGAGARSRCGPTPGAAPGFSRDRDRRPLLRRDELLCRRVRAAGRRDSGARISRRTSSARERLGHFSPEGLGPGQGPVGALAPGRKGAVGVEPDDPQAQVAQGLAHPVLVAHGDKDRQLVKGVPGGGGQHPDPGQLQAVCQVIVESPRGHVQVGVAGNQGQAGPDEAAQEQAPGFIFPHRGQGPIEQGMMGQKQLRLVAFGLPHHRGGGLQGHQDEVHRGVRGPPPQSRSGRRAPPRPGDRRFPAA